VHPSNRTPRPPVIISGMGPGCVKSARGVTPRQRGSFWTRRAAKSLETVL
jgi:hypothetical protein